jgi:hypothetical protein
MAKHGKKSDVTATQGNPVIRALNNAGTGPSPERIAKDVEIIDNGWNNTEEGKADIATNGASRSGKHAR